MTATARLLAGEIHFAGDPQTFAFETSSNGDTGSATADVPKFNSSLGTLTQVDYSASVVMDFKFDITMVDGHLNHQVLNYGWMDTSWNPGSPYKVYDHSPPDDGTSFTTVIPDGVAAATMNPVVHSVIADNTPFTGSGSIASPLVQKSYTGAGLSTFTGSGNNQVTLHALASFFEFGSYRTIYHDTGVDVANVRGHYDVMYTFTPSNAWSGSSGGNWNATGNWSGGTVPNASCAVAYFGEAGSAKTVNVNVPVTLGTFVIDSTASYTFSGSSTLTMSCSNPTNISVSRGSHTISAPLAIATDGGVSLGNGTTSLSVGALSIASGKTWTIGGGGTVSVGGTQAHGSDAVLAVRGSFLNLNTDAGSSSSSPLHLDVAGAATASLGSTQHLASLAINNASTVKVTSGGSKLLVTSGLSLDGDDDAGRDPALPFTSKLDLADRNMIVHYTSTSPRPAIQAALVRGRHAGAWDGNGITSSAAPAQASHATTLGLLEGTEYRSIYGTSATFNGEAVDTTSVLVKYTWYGDANFSGTVNGSDYARIDAGYNAHYTGWLNGDFDLNGVVNGSDYALIDFAYNAQSGTLSRAAAFLNGDGTISNVGDPLSALGMVQEHFEQFGAPYAQAFLTAVPEPSTSLLPATVGAWFGLRRRRSRAYRGGSQTSSAIGR